MPHSTQTEETPNPDGSSRNAFDYIIVGAGIAGTTLASRLVERYPQRTVLVIEAGQGPEKYGENPLVPQPLMAPMMRGGELDWKYTSTPQEHLGGRQIYEAAGKAVGGGSVINYGLWTRGDRRDYDEWVKLSGDPKWSYDALLPYFRKSESHFDPSLDPKQHGLTGPVPLVSPDSTNRHYPLRKPLEDAWAQAGITKITNGNSGSPIGVGSAIECRQNRERIIANNVYPLKNVHVLSETLVARVLVEDSDGKKVATGVELANGSIELCKREVILSAGGMHTPKILLLSGIGPARELAKHGIPQVVDAPQVGKNYFGHLNLKQFWKIRHPETGAAIGHEKWSNPEYKGANPLDHIVCQSYREGLKEALAVDEPDVTDEHHLLANPRSHAETFIQYAAVNKENPALKPDGTHIQTIILIALPTARGTISLQSWDPHALPVMEANYYSTEADRHAMRSAVRKIHEVFFETEAGKEIIVGETHGSDRKPLTSKSTDEEIDTRVALGAESTSHPCGTAAMGKVVDGDLKVYGVEGLRVCDASIFPAPVAAHPMAGLYALGERMADMLD